MLCAIAVLASCSRQAPQYHGPVLPAPLQQTLRAQAEFDWDGEYRLQPKAQFDASVLVLRATRHSGGSLPFSALDFGVAWGIAATPDLLSRVEYWHSGRFLYWRAPADIYQQHGRALQSSASNFHLMADADVLDALRKVKPGEVVRLVGRLVDVRADRGRHWRTSLSRDDSGAGACEIVLVEQLYRCPGNASSPCMRDAR